MLGGAWPSLPAAKPSHPQAATETQKRKHNASFHASHRACASLCFALCFAACFGLGFRGVVGWGGGVLGAELPVGFPGGWGAGGGVSVLLDLGRLVVPQGQGHLDLDCLMLGIREVGKHVVCSIPGCLSVPDSV